MAGFSLHHNKSTNKSKMDGLNLGSSVTLVVKTPNKTIDDLQISCALDWTVRKIKQHLSSVYPSKPESKKQRLIYSGQLLHDHQTLKDFLREHQDGKLHTVHLVCPPSSTENLSSNPSSSQETSTSTLSTQTKEASTSRELPSASSQTTAQPTTDGVRYRGHSTPTPSPFMNVPNPQMWNTNAGQHSFQGQMYPQFPPLPDHQVWMQHMQNMQQQYQQMFQQYQQQMAATRQPYPPFMNMPPNMQMPPIPFWPPQGLMMPGAQPVNRTPQVSQQQVPQQMPQAPPPQAQNAPQGPMQQQARNQEVRMNAQGGIADDDEEEENINNDWLDKIYTLCRIAILLSIVWFYSSTGRFLMLILSVVLIYMYQWGVFQWLLRNRNYQVNNPPPQPQPQPQPVRQEEGARDNNHEDRGDTEDGTESNEGEDAIQQPPPPPPGPSAFRIAMNFVSSFFTSLVPQQHDGLQAN